jgi:hypothetical protein
MDVVEQNQRILIADQDSGKDVFLGAIGFALFTLGLGAVSAIVGWFFPVWPLQGTELVGGLAVVLTLFAVIALFALVERRLCCVIDIEGRRITHAIEYWFWPWPLRFRNRRTEMAFSDVEGLGVAERSVEGGYEYTPVLTRGGKRLTLSFRAGSYLGLDRKLDDLRARTGLAKRDHG